jgi:hypothetical protein
MSNPVASSSVTAIVPALDTLNVRPVDVMAVSNPGGALNRTILNIEGPESFSTSRR